MGRHSLPKPTGGNALDRLIERKQMSTKTTFKRVALVAVAALGFGVLTSVAPASATQATVAEVTAVTVAAPATGRIGSPLASAVGFTTASLAATSEIDLAGIFVSKPAGSTATVIFDNTGLALVGAAGGTAVFTAGTGFQPSKLVVDSTGTAYTSGAHVAGRVGFIPDVAGDYVVKVWHDANANGAIDPTEAVAADRTFTVGAAPTAVTITRINSTFCASGSNGALVKLTLPTGTGLALGESIRVTPSTATADITLVNGSAVTYTAGTTTYVDVIGSQFTGGVAWLNITDSASFTLTLAGQGTSVSAITGTASLTAKTCSTAGTGTTVIQGATAGAAFTSVTDGINGTSTTATIPLAAKTITYYSAFTAGNAAGDYFKATVTDTNGRVTGSASQSITGLVYDIAYVGAANATTAATIEGTFSVSLSPTATGQGYSVVTANGTALTSGVTTDSSATSAGTVTVSPSAALSLKIGGSITYAVTVKDKFARAIPNMQVAMAITGRNANQTVINPTTVTGSTGIATFTVTDAPAAGTTSLTDSIVFTATGTDATQKASTAVTITWSATGPVVGTVTILGGNNTTTTGVAADAPDYKDIAAGTSGASATTATAVATVKDAAGNLLAGVPVTFTISGTTAAVLSTTQTVYTGATGTATGNVYAWATGSYTVTATAGTVAGTAVYAFRQTAAGEERAISATVSGNIVTAKVVDRFGNTVPLVTVYATKTGVGYFGAGVLKTTAVTDNAGEASFIIAGGDAEVTVATYDIATAVAPLGSGQSCARAGTATCNVAAADDTALTASAAGTATTAEKGVGASFAAAGVAKATVSVTGDNAAQAAADAAAEATDAANAATDAANAAAEAADAATAAAQDAADAVAALSTQVAEMVNALKKQITALTNLVIKIQKKVKA